MAADALSGLRYLAPGSPPSQARQAQRRRAIMPSAAFVPDGGSRLIRPTLFGAGFAPFAGPASTAPPGNIPGTVPCLCRMAADALSGLRYLAPGSPPSQARQAQRRRAIMPSAAFVPDGGSRLIRPTLFGAGFAPFAGPASAAPPGNHIECHVCAGWRLTPYPAYVIWRRVPPLSRPGKRSAAGQSRRVPRLCRMAADALSGLRYLAPGSPPSQARQAQRRRAIYPAQCRVCAGWRLTPYPVYVIWRRVRPLSRPGKRSAAGQSGWGVYAASRGM